MWEEFETESRWKLSISASFFQKCSQSVIEHLLCPRATETAMCKTKKAPICPQEVWILREEITIIKCHNEMILDDGEANIFLENGKVGEVISEKQIQWGKKMDVRGRAGKEFR